MAHANRFDLIRLLLANCVFLYHLVALASPVPGSILEYRLALLAEGAIQGFFIVSGALVYGSLQRSTNLRDYAGKRLRRLYPAYAVIILFPAVISLWLTGAWADVLRYVGSNLIFLNFLEPTLPGLFEQTRFVVVNGALWTLKIEVMFYACLPLLVWALARAGAAWPMLILALVGLSFSWWLYWSQLGTLLGDQLARQLPGQMMFFCAGIALWRSRAWCQKNAVYLTLFGSVSLMLAAALGLGRLGQVLGLACFIGGLAYLPGRQWNVTRWGDVSYGVYIVHFPVLQAVIAAGLFTRLGMIGAGLLSAVLIYGVSYLLWWVVERPALRRDSHYRRVADR